MCLCPLSSLSILLHMETPHCAGPVILLAEQYSLKDVIPVWCGLLWHVPIHLLSAHAGGMEGEYRTVSYIPMCKAVGCMNL